MVKLHTWVNNEVDEEGTRLGGYVWHHPQPGGGPGGQITANSADQREEELGKFWSYIL